MLNLPPVPNLSMFSLLPRQRRSLTHAGLRLRASRSLKLDVKGILRTEAVTRLEVALLVR